MKRILKKGHVILTIACLCFFMTVNAQSTIRGKVVDEKGRPIPGVNVVLKGQEYYTVADQNGIFSIENVEPDSVIVVFRFIGYQPVDEAIALDKEPALYQMMVIMPKERISSKSKARVSVSRVAYQR